MIGLMNSSLVASLSMSMRESDFNLGKGSSLNVAIEVRFDMTPPVLLLGEFSIDLVPY